jgi:multidrug efflux pump
MFSSYQINVPQLDADIDRTKAKQQGVPVTDVFDTLQIYLGSLYANDFNRFGRTYQVRVQADADFRARAEDIGRSRRATPAARWCRWALMRVTPSLRPGPWCATTASRRRHQRRAGARLLSAQAAAAAERIAAETLPRGMKLRMDRPHLPGDPGRQRRRCGSSPSACCWSSWCWPPSTRA